MTRINLLPWREKYIEIQNRRFGLLCGLAVALSLIICLIFKIIFSVYLSGVSSDKDYLSKEMSNAQNKMQEVSSLLAKKDSLIKRIKIIEKLQIRRNLGTEILDSIAKSLPSKVILIEVSSKENKIKIVGVASGNDEVSDFMKKIDKNSWVAEAVLSEIKNNDLSKNNVANPDILALPIKFSIDINLKV